MPNPINICIDRNNDCSGYYVTVDNGKIENNECKYSVIPEKTGELTISVFKNNGKLIKKKVFRVEELILEAYVLGMPNQSKNYIQNINAFSHAAGLSTMHKDVVCWDWDNSNLNYELMIIKSKNQVISFKSQVNKFSEEMRKEFEILNSGDFLIFHSISLNGMQVKDLILEVK